MDDSNSTLPSNQPPRAARRKPSPGHALVALGAILLIGGSVFYVVTREQEPAGPSNGTQTEAIPPTISQISLTEQGFTPSTIKVSTGTSVMWTNTDVVPRNLKSNALGLETDDALSQNDQIIYTFEIPGTYTIYDADRPNIKCVIHVE